MIYVASPRFSQDPAARAANLKECLETASKHLDETSRSSSAEKMVALIESAVRAGWEENEVRAALSAPPQPGAEAADTPSPNVVMSSSM
ncbi:hypothetical protein [Rhizobium sp. Rhizsp82]|uniref:hypothetical protein n=1 Tax=Rhizobium sp. Rhizsp82 TaxID=3243057 RepID=UPI0039B6801C